MCSMGLGDLGFSPDYLDLDYVVLKQVFVTVSAAFPC